MLGFDKNTCAEAEAVARATRLAREMETSKDAGWPWLAAGQSVLVFKQPGGQEYPLGANVTDPTKCPRVRLDAPTMIENPDENAFVMWSDKRCNACGVGPPEDPPNSKNGTDQPGDDRMIRFRDEEEEECGGDDDEKMVASFMKGRRSAIRKTRRAMRKNRDSGEESGEGQTTQMARAMKLKKAEEDNNRRRGRNRKGRLKAMLRLGFNTADEMTRDRLDGIKGEGHSRRTRQCIFPTIGCEPRKESTEKLGWHKHQRVGQKRRKQGETFLGRPRGSTPV